MGLFDFLKPPPPLPHEAFGPLHYAHRRWRGVISIEPGTRTTLFLPGSRDGPAPHGLHLAERAQAWWAQVRPQVQAELYEHYEAGRDAGVDGVPELSGPNDIWLHVTLSSVQVQPYSAPDELQVALRVPWDEEHTLGALIRDGRLVELNGSILEPR